MWLLAACSATTRYQVLSFFFDGVPDPNAPVSTEQLITPVPERFVYQPPQPDPATLPKMHRPYADRKCDACHKSSMDRKQRDPTSFNVADAAALRMPVEQLCRSCHPLTEQPYQHAPALMGECVRCHQPHASTNSHLLLTPKVRGLCVPCHTAEMMTSEAQHAGYADRDCCECHDPHAADARAFLKAGWDGSGGAAAPAPEAAPSPPPSTSPAEPRPGSTAPAAAIAPPRGGN
ncbi:MAG: hypothetical protein JNN13_09900 [Planctomycetes bacterium]|nr:hypothetical protein [Planctomycetota bacterium]